MAAIFIANSYLFISYLFISKGIFLCSKLNFLVNFMSSKFLPYLVKEFHYHIIENLPKIFYHIPFLAKLIKIILTDLKYIIFKYEAVQYQHFGIFLIFYFNSVILTI